MIKRRNPCKEGIYDGKRCESDGCGFDKLFMFIYPLKNSCPGILLWNLFNKQVRVVWCINCVMHIRSR